MARQYEIVSFLTDYGLSDEFVGVVKSVVHSIAPQVSVIDVTHDIPAFDVRAGSLALVRSVNYLCPGVVLAVVDPGVGTSRRAVAVEVGEGESVLVGPDNGLLAPAVAMVGGATRAVELTNPTYQLSGVSRTFAGRDVFGPAAAHLANGVDLLELGEIIDPAVLTPGLIPFSSYENGVLHAEVLWVDRYGNVQLNVVPEQLDDLGTTILLAASGKQWRGRRVSTFAELKSSENGLLEDASGLIAIVRNSASAEAELELVEGTSVTLTAG